MKSIKQLLLIISSTFILFSCNKQTGNGAVGGVSTGTMTANIAGASWSATTAVQASKQGAILVLAGTGSGSQINITVGSYTGPGTYNISNANPSNVAIYTKTSSNPIEIYTANAIFGSGSVNVTSDADNVIEGSFQFTGLNEGSLSQKAITEGAFKIKY